MRTEDDICLYELKGLSLTNRVSLYLKEKHSRINYGTNFHSDVLCLKNIKLSQMANAIYNCICDKSIMSGSCSTMSYLA